jgi:hypothetical protein
MNVASSMVLRMVIILQANKVNLFVSFVLFVFWYHSPNFLDTPRIWHGTFAVTLLNSATLYSRMKWQFLNTL